MNGTATGEFDLLRTAAPNDLLDTAAHNDRLDAAAPSGTSLGTDVAAATAVTFSQSTTAAAKQLQKDGHVQV